MKRDDILLNEAYKKVHAPESQPENVDEAFNVTRARLAGLGGAVKGLKNRVVGGIQSGVGSMGAKVAGVDPSQAPTYQAGQAKVQKGKDAGTNAKIDSILKNQTQDINKFASKLTNQLVKLGLGNSATVGEIANGMTTKLKEVLAQQAPATNQLNAGSPTPAPAPASAPTAASATRSSFSSGPTDQELADLNNSISNPAPAATTPTPAPAAAASSSNPNQPPVQQTSTAAQAADAMKADDTGSATPEETQPEAEAPATEAPEQAAPTGEVPPDNAPQNVASQEEIENAQPEPEDPKPKINKSTHTAAKSGKVYAWRKVKSKDGNWGQAWKNIETGEIPTKGAQEAITAGWTRAQKKALTQQVEQPAQQNESFKSFFWKV